jgi:N6-adenosine-specific RNA methylase IME4
MTAYEYHPLAEVFPLLEGEAFDALAADIKARGLIDAITTHDGKILDGRNRYRACEAAGVTPEFVEWDGDPLAFVISVNLKRRHLTPSQRAMIGARLTRLKKGGLREFARLTHVEAAKAVDINEREIRSAVKVIEGGRLSLVRAVDEGRVLLDRAVELVEEPDEVQDRLAELPAADVAEHHERLKRDRRREKFFKTSGVAAFEAGKWSVIYADPPWRDEFGPSARAIENHYATMTTDQILQMDVESISAEHAVLFLWAIPHMIEQALQTMKAWGFEYKTHLIWSKNKIGLGKWARNEHELLLIGRRGAMPPPPEELRVGSVIEAPVGEHSAKPVKFLEIIEAWYPDAAKIELFKRGGVRRGWSSWGNQATQADDAAE